MIADLQRRRAILFILACTAALSIHSILLSIDKLEIIIEGTEDEFHRILYDIEGSDEDDDAELLAIPAFLLDDDESGNNNSIPREEEGASLSTTTMTSYAQLIDTNRPLPPYTIEDALQVSKLYDSTFALLVYDPEDDMFIGLYSENHRWRPPCQKLTNSFRNIAYLLRKIFPERFRGTESDELGKFMTYSQHMNMYILLLIAICYFTYTYVFNRSSQYIPILFLSYIDTLQLYRLDREIILGSKWPVSNIIVNKLMIPKLPSGT